MGFNYLQHNNYTVNVDAYQYDNETIIVQVDGADLTHYYISKKGEPRIYMGTIYSKVPLSGWLRYILRSLHSQLPNGPEASEILDWTYKVEASDVYGLANGETRSKHYSNERLKDWSYIGATGTDVGLWIVRGNSEGMSGGPFYRSLLNQGASDQEITYIVNYGMAQTEALRSNILNLYTIVFTDGSTPPDVDTTWLEPLGLEGWVSSSDRGSVSCAHVLDMDTSIEYTAGLSNSAAMYWGGVDSSTYNLTIYKNELEVYTSSVDVIKGKNNLLDVITITDDPSFKSAFWRIGEWDGSPKEFLNGEYINYMHPSDVRMNSWNPGPIYISNFTNNQFPAYQWKEINGAIEVKFNLTESEIVNYILRVGITIAYSGGRPSAQMNSWYSGSAMSSQPRTRSLTVGTYRGNNHMYKFSIPASAFIVGENTLTLRVLSGSSGSGYLSPGISYDAVDLIVA
ncbi:hypothetical protein DAMA08_009790 [Martiniozyma asiatica (nom. inval.)]|nr:hypothetical protein DAMA08_009790 [Martiniozyma asiatica]